MDMQKTEPEEDQIGNFIPKPVLRRKALLEEGVAEVKKRKPRSLDETNPHDLKWVIDIIWDKHPESNYYKVREYAKVVIRLWNKTKNR